MRDEGPHIRAAVAADLPALAGLWLASAQAAHDYLPALRALDAVRGRRVFLEVVAPGLELYVAERGGEPVGLLGLTGTDLLDRLYIAPHRQGEGVGGALLAHAKRSRPAGLRLFTHQKNARARAFYARRGFRVLRFGVSPAPESEPDVEMVWSPQGAGS